MGTWILKGTIASDLAGGIQILGLVVALTSYPVFLLFVETKWFSLSSTEEAPRLYAFRTFLVSGTWAIGEFLYGAVQDGLWIRAAATLIASLFLVAFLAIE